MKHRLNIVTLGVQDIEASKLFYSELFEWRVSTASNEHVVFFDGPGVCLGLFGRAALAKDAEVDESGTGFRGVSLAHNLPSKEEVNHFMEKAVSIGAEQVKAPQDVFWGGYSGYFKDRDAHLWEIAWNPFFPLDDDGAIKLP